MKRSDKIHAAHSAQNGLGKSKTHVHEECCDTKELNDFIKKFVTVESLEPAVTAFTAHSHHCHCDDEHDDVNINITDFIMRRNAKQFVPELEILLAGHGAWCGELEEMMRNGKVSEFDLSAVGEGLMCCIGKWLKCECDSSGMRDYPEYLSLVQHYANFQRCAEDMLENHQRGRFSDAVLILRGDFVEQSNFVQKSLFDLVAVLLEEESAPVSHQTRTVLDRCAV